MACNDSQGSRHDPLHPLDPLLHPTSVFLFIAFNKHVLNHHPRSYLRSQAWLRCHFCLNGNPRQKQTCLKKIQGNWSCFLSWPAFMLPLFLLYLLLLFPLSFPKSIPNCFADFWFPLGICNLSSPFETWTLIKTHVFKSQRGGESNHLPSSLDSWADFPEARKKCPWGFTRAVLKVPIPT